MLALETLQPGVDVLILGWRSRPSGSYLYVDGPTAVDDVTHMLGHVYAADRTLVEVPAHVHGHVYTCDTWKLK